MVTQRPVTMRLEHVMPVNLILLVSTVADAEMVTMGILPMAKQTLVNHACALVNYVRTISVQHATWIDLTNVWCVMHVKTAIWADGVSCVQMVSMGCQRGDPLVGAMTARAVGTSIQTVLVTVTGEQESV